MKPSTMNKQPIVIAPSILSARFGRLAEEVNAVISAGADWIHFDVMDNHFVPNLTVGPMVCKALRDEGIKAPIDVHLMVSPVDSLISPFVAAGATMITFHPEATYHVHRTLQFIRSLNCQAGIALNPATPIEVLTDILPDLDMILVMSVNPGFGGQAFIPQMLHKIQRVREMIDACGKPIRLEVDGGVNLDNIRAIADAGADTFVMGTAIFGSKKGYPETIQEIMEKLA
ncbi:MAG: ribulose-phosphate 3-epimerase [Gammaproteobacteria bacterium]